MKNLNQRGILNILMLLIVIAGIGLGSYYIRQQTQLKPQASSTVACDGQTLNSQSAESQGAFRTAYGSDAEAEWVRQHEAELVAKGTPCGQGEGAKCALDNKDSISSACANEIDSKNPEFMAEIEKTRNKDVCTRAQVISNWCASNPSDCNAKKQGIASCGSTSGGSSPVCPVPTDPKKSVDETYKQAKVANNLVRYYGIMKGITEYCTPADLGVLPPLVAKDNSGSEGRLLLCSGKDSTEQKPVLVWNVIIGNSIKISTKTAPTMDNVGSQTNLDKALSAVGLGGEPKGGW